MFQFSRYTVSLIGILLLIITTSLACGDSHLNKVKHIVILMQENHSFDNYLGALAYAPGSPYHNGKGACPSDDHSCVDGLTCSFDSSGNLNCANSNKDADGTTVVAFHNSSRCVIPDLDHTWVGAHREINFANPNSALINPLNDGFVLQNDVTEQPDQGTPSFEDSTISYYTQDDLNFYYYLAEHFAISDRQFSSLLGPTFPNRAYLMAATSFRHVSNIGPPTGGFKPTNGTIFDLLDKNGVSWADYYQDLAQSLSFRPFDAHNLPLAVFYSQAAGRGSLPQVSLIDPNFGSVSAAAANDEHPPTDIQRGQYFVSQVVNAIRNGPFWKDTIIFITYDEHGGFYDHVPPPQATQNKARTPDGVFPGQSTTKNTPQDAEALCPALAQNPVGPFPASCAAFDQLGVRVPLIAVSPFSKPQYVSHAVGDHTSLLALIEKRFLASEGGPLHLTKRDQYANPLEDLFDFDNSPSLNTPVIQAQPPLVDCTP
ncbi:MAG TPA: alkaline phosphatase family protein [Terriglobales bacterium]|nr:alkaline phosphatase family protein [Terriglobales bacterium]